MNELQEYKNSITSIEVAEMVEKEHSRVLKDIRRYSEHINQANLDLVNADKIALVEFWTESAYTDAKGQSRPCYLVTKKGCEFIAHKMTGAKGTVFTARYINRFHEMETTVNENKAVIQKEMFFIPEKSLTPVPKRSGWYQKNKSLIRSICDRLDITHKELYHTILVYIGKDYDIKAANEIYKRERGYYPEYAIDIVSYFPELEQMADDALESLDEFSKKKLKGE